MIQSIWKFKLGISGEIEMPVDAKVLSVANQYEDVCLWALCNPGVYREIRKFLIVGTGWQHDLPLGRFIGTVILSEGKRVLHVFESQDPPVAIRLPEISLVAHDA